MKKKTKEAKENETLRRLLLDLIWAAERVSNKYGTDDDGVPSDWKEWIAVRVACQEARTKGKLGDQ